MNNSYLTIFFIVVVAMFQACTSDDKKSGSISVEHTDDYQQYYYGSDSIYPYALVFQDSAYPIDERFVRYIQIDKNDTNKLIIERYNASLRIYEGVTLDIDNNLEILDHMMVDAQGIKRTSGFKSTTFFPLKKDEQIIFKTDFPSHLDSIVMIYEARKHIDEVALEKEINGKNHSVIKVRDSIFVSMVNTYTGEGSTQSGIVDSYYAKGIGLVQWGDHEGSINYLWTKTLKDDLWEKLNE